MRGVFINPGGRDAADRADRLAAVGRVELASQNADFSGLRSARDTVFDLDGVAPDFSGLTDIDGSSFLVSGGVTVSLPNVFSYRHASTGDSQYRRFQASGAGSVLDLSGLRQLTGGTDYDVAAVRRSVGRGTGGFVRGGADRGPGRRRPALRGRST